MKQLCMGVAMLGAALVAAPALGYAQQPVDIGKREYVNSCAVCHGDNGKGDGPLGGFLNKAPTDLTTIQKNNMGVFPFDRVYEVIDGRQAAAFHGTRDMPVWGKWYSIEGEGDFYGLSNVESSVRGRTIALIGYIYTLQAK